MSAGPPGGVQPSGWWYHSYSTLVQRRHTATQGPLGPTSNLHGATQAPGWRPQEQSGRGRVLPGVRGGDHRNSTGEKTGTKLGGDHRNSHGESMGTHVLRVLPGVETTGTFVGRARVLPWVETTGTVVGRTRVLPGVETTGTVMGRTRVLPGVETTATVVGTARVLPGVEITRIVVGTTRGEGHKINTVVGRVQIPTGWRPQI